MRALHMTGTCRVCGKVRYPTRKEAKRAIRMFYPGEANEYNAYQCDGTWHIGHLAPDVKAGRKTRDEHYKRAV